jgi:hypothetical protein
MAYLLGVIGIMATGTIFASIIALPV